MTMFGTAAVQPKSVLPPVPAGVVSALLVLVTTAALWLLQSILIGHENGLQIRPYGILYMIPIAASAFLGGERSGTLALILSLVSSVTIMDTDPQAWSLHSARNAVELILMMLVGSLMIGIVSIMRHNAALSEAIQEVGRRQRIFVRDVLASVTDRRLLLCAQAEDLPVRLTPYGDPIPLTATDLQSLRRLAGKAASQLDYPEDRLYDLVTAVGEGAMNAVVHGGGGTGRVYVDPRGTVQVWVEDCGRGIVMESLPQATLERGFTTAGSLGHGFWIMLNTVDRLWLLTGPEGTTLVIEQDRTPLEPAWQRKY